LQFCRPTDKNEDGCIDFEEFIRGVRDELTPRRLALVKEAFGKLDTDASGVVDIDEMKLIYDVSKHPDFIDGKKTKAEILRVFMESFEGGGDDAGDGKITLGEFTNYYSNLGVSVDSDDYFELMIRNAWHMSGGDGAAANSANKRVLVTHADGTQEVVEIKNDLGLKEGDTADLLRRLSLQGVQASQVTTSSGVELMPSNSAKAKAASASAKTLLLSRLASEERTKAASSPSKLFGSKAPSSPTAGKRSTSAGAFSSSIGGLINGNTGGIFGLPKPPPVAASQIFQPQVSVAVSAGSATHRSVEMPLGIKSLMGRMKAELKEHGARGFYGLQRKFRIMDDDNSGSLSLGEFKKGLRELGLDIVDSEARALFDHFDYANAGTISYDNFIIALRSDLTPRRLDLVKQAFSALDSNGDGVLNTSELLEKYDATRHPDVTSGKRSEEDVLREWVQVFEVGGDVDGKVSIVEFINYYTNLSASIDEEDYFELMIRNAWHMSGGDGAAQNSANARVLVTKDDGSQQVMEVKNDLGARSKEQLLARVKRQDVHAHTINLFGGGADGIDEDDKPPSAPAAPRGLAGRRFVAPRLDAFKATISQTGTMSILGGVEAPLPPAPLELPPPPPKRASSPTRRVGTPLSVLAASAARGIPEILAQIKSALAARGTRGIVSLNRKLRVLDSNQNNFLSQAEFKNAMSDCGVKLSEEEYALLVKFFDNDKRNEINYEEFLRGLRGTLSDRRAAAISAAFNSLDKGRNGLLDPAHIMQIFDAAQHPDALNGTRTSQEVLREFLETFEVGGQVDGKVTADEFMQYYHNVSSSVGSDDAFEGIIRNTWHLEAVHATSEAAARVPVLPLPVNTQAQTLANLRAQANQNRTAGSISFDDQYKDTTAVKQRRGAPVQSRDSPFLSQSSVPAPVAVQRTFGHDKNRSSLTLG